MPSSHDPLALAKLRGDIDKLADRFDAMQPTLVDARRGKRQRKLFFLVAMLLIIGLAVDTWLYIGVVMARSNARDYYNTELTRLACIAVRYTPSSASPTIHDLRAQYHCPPAIMPPNAPRSQHP